MKSNESSASPSALLGASEISPDSVPVRMKRPKGKIKHTRKTVENVSFLSVKILQVQSAIGKAKHDIGAHSILTN